MKVQRGLNQKVGVAVRGNQASELAGLRARVCGGATILLILLSGCTNNLLQNAISTATSVTTGVTAGGTSTTANASGLVLAAVQLDTFNPTTTLDLLGDGSGAMGTACTAVSGGTTGQTTCTCSYSYLEANGTQIGPVDVPTIYSESNMLRCSYTTVPSGVSSIVITVHLTNSDQHSNQVTFKFSSTAAGGIDLANPNSFSLASRYQCRDIVFVPYMWDNDVYDPFLSENPQYSYPLNFYTSNMGLTFSQYANDANSLGWNCPALPNDTSAGMDLTLYSASADASGSKSIYPPTGSFDRSTFYLANAAAGVFSIPVNAYVYPGMVSSVTAGTGAQVGPAPLGYAASPIPLTSGGETCPDSSVTIPAGFHWAKLWLFRKQLPQRSYPTSTTLAQFGGGNQGNGIACNGPNWSVTPVAAAPYNTYFTDCAGAPTYSSVSSTTGLAARFSEATASCYNVIPGGATDPISKNNYNASTLISPYYPSVDFSTFAAGTDIWKPNHADPKNGCTGTAPGDTISHACNSATGNVPFDQTGSATGLIDSSTANPRYDFLFVVSPPSVYLQDMLPTATSSIHSIYTPIRFMSPTDCKSADPDQPTFPGDCSSSRMLTYGIEAAQAGSAGQTGSTDPDSPTSFPMCVLQPN